MSSDSQDPIHQNTYEKAYEQKQINKCKKHKMQYQKITIIQIQEKWV